MKLIEHKWMREADFYLLILGGLANFYLIFSFENCIFAAISFFATSLTVGGGIRSVRKATPKIFQFNTGDGFLKTRI